MRRGRAARAVVCGVLACLAGCEHTPDSAFGPGEWEVVLRVPGDAVEALASTPDGALFVVTARALYRGTGGGTVRMERVADDSGGCCQRATAPSSRQIYLLGGGTLRVWREGVGEQVIALPATPAWMGCGSDCFLAGLPIDAVWARAEGDAYAVGSYGTVVHVVGDRAELEPNPLLEYARGHPYAPEIYRAGLQAVGGDATRVYAPSWWALLRKEAGTWDTVPHPVRHAGDCLVNAVAVQGRAVLYGGNVGFPRAEMPCLVRVERGVATRLDGRLRGFGQPGIFRGEAQPDGTALFYASAYGRGEVAEVQGERVRVYRFPALRWFGGAATLGAYLYAGGQLGDTAVVVRVRRR